MTLPSRPHSVTIPACLVVGASGGVGASTLAAAVGAAVADQMGSAGATLIDLHLRGGGLDVTVGLEHLRGPRWPDLARARGRVDGIALRGLLPADAGCAILAADGRRWRATTASLDPDVRVGEDPPDPNAAGLSAALGLTTAVTTVLAALRQTGSPIVFDCPVACVPAVRRPGDVLVLVASTHVRGLADLDAAIAALDDQRTPRDGPLLLVTRGGPSDGEVLDAIVEQVGVPVFGHLPDDRRIPKAVARGQWPGRSGLVRRIALDISEVAGDLAA